MKRRGITLLELLLASAMLIVLMSIVWTAILFLTRVEMRREQQTKQQRIVRNWTAMLHNDFLSAIQDTEQLNKAEGSETIRHFGVRGTATQLWIDITDFSWRTEESSEVRRVFYGFQQQGGLVRQEWDYAALESVEGLWQAAPEIESGQFRYFDGGTWQEHWSSLDQKSAPSAIEVMFYRSSSEEREQHRMIVQIPASSFMNSEFSRIKPFSGVNFTALDNRLVTT